MPTPPENFSSLPPSPRLGNQLTFDPSSSTRAESRDLPLNVAGSHATAAPLPRNATVDTVPSERKAKAALTGVVTAGNQAKAAQGGLLRQPPVQPSTLGGCRDPRRVRRPSSSLLSLRRHSRHQVTRAIAAADDLSHHDTGNLQVIREETVPISADREHLSFFGRGALKNHPPCLEAFHCLISQQWTFKSLPEQALLRQQSLCYIL